MKGAKVLNNDLIARSTAKADYLAMEAARCAVVDIEWILSEPVPECFGAKWLSRITNAKKIGSTEYERALYEYAVRSFIYAKNHGAAFMKYSGAGNSGNLVNKALCSPDGYADYEGRASTLYSHLGSSNADLLFAELKHLDFHRKPSDPATLDAMAVVWFYEAAREYRKNSVDVFDLLFEVSDTLSLSVFICGWDSGGQSAESEATHRKSEAARAAAVAKNKPHNDAREKLLGIWKSGQYKTRTECVMNELSDLVSYCGRSIAFRTACEWLTGVDKD